MEKWNIEDCIKYLEEKYSFNSSFDAAMIMTLCREYKAKVIAVQPDVSGSLPLTIDRVSKMLASCSKDTWIAVQGDEHGWKEWWKKRNTQKVNGNDH